MEDLADVIDDVICTFENATNTTMDTLAMLIFGWILIALLVLWLGKFIYNRYKRGHTTAAATDTTAAKTKPIADVVKPDVDGVGVEKAVVKKSAPKVASSPKGGGISGAASPQGVIGASSGGSGGSAYVPPTPPTRKRLSRRSPGPDLLLKKPSHHPKPAPKATGSDPPSVQWVNDLFLWFYNDLVVVNELLGVWIHSLNEFTKKSVTEHGVGVEFVRMLPETPPPTFNNVFCECAQQGPQDEVTVTMDCESAFAMQLKCFRQRGERVDTAHYRVNVTRFRARLSAAGSAHKLRAHVRSDGWPDVKVSLAPVGAIRTNNTAADETQLQEVVIEIITNALRNIEVELNLGQFPTCPRMVRHPEIPANVLPVHYDGMMGNMFSSTPNHHTVGSGGTTPINTGDKRLLVKIIRANQLKKASENVAIEPYCVVEMDEPFQKNQTSVKKDSESPVWDEHFLFDLSSNTAELLFEIYDRANKSNRFLGLGIVGVEELLINPSQRQIISLQSRPYEQDDVTGTLTVEFLFIEGADIPVTSGKPYKLKETLRTVSPSGQQLITTKTILTHNDTLANGTADLTDSALKELERNRQGNNANKSTLIIHSVQRAGELQPMPTIQNNTLPRDGDRGRSRKKRDFFGTIKRRLGKSATRSKSATGSTDAGVVDGNDSAVNRSISADRGRNISGEGYQLPVPTLNKSTGETNSRRSSLSEISGVSGTSTRTYLNEASTLVLETLENGVKKHYLVPLSLAQRSRWRKKGIKLHIFNDHTFIAKHLPGGTVCQICSKNIGRRIGKQGYECRDCLIKCHKHCHVKINDNCPTSTIHNMELSLLPVLSE